LGRKWREEALVYFNETHQHIRKRV